jgi:uncharacterized protein (TIGR00297 family)
MPTNQLANQLSQIALGLVLSSLIAWAAYRRRALTKSGAWGAVLTGTAIFGFGGLDWGLLLIAFFVSSSLLTRYKEAAKAGVAEQFAKGGPRDVWQALANGGIAALIAVVYGVTGTAHLPLLFAFVGAIAEANADTWATELGVLSRETPRLITTREPVAPGASGGVTWDGTGAAMAAAAIIGGLAALFGWIGRMPLNVVVLLLPIGALAGVIGSLVDSVLGATLQGIYFCDACGKETERELHRCGNRTRLLRGWRALNNDWVNLIGTLVGAAVAGGLGMLLAR